MLKYLLLIITVVILAIADFITGLIKGACTTGIKSQKMRIGGLHKISEIVIIIAMCGFDYMLSIIGNYYNLDSLSAWTSGITSFAVFAYIVIMELISIFENYAAINPEASWVQKLLEKLKK